MASGCEFMFVGDRFDRGSNPGPVLWAIEKLLATMSGFPANHREKEALLVLDRFLKYERANRRIIADGIVEAWGREPGPFLDYTSGFVDVRFLSRRGTNDRIRFDVPPPFDVTANTQAAIILTTPIGYVPTPWERKWCEGEHR